MQYVLWLKYTVQETQFALEHGGIIKTLIKSLSYHDWNQKFIRWLIKFCVALGSWMHLNSLLWSQVNYIGLILFSYIYNESPWFSLKSHSLSYD